MKKVTVLYTTVNNAASFRPYNDKVQTIVDEKLDELWKTVTVIDDYDPSTEGASDDLDICEKYFRLHNQISTDTLKTAIVNCGSEVKWYQDTRDEGDIGHTSMSVGDIVKIEDEDGTRLFYCDDVGFLQIDYIGDPTSRTYQDAHQTVTLSHEQIDDNVTRFYSEDHNAEFVIFDRSLKNALPVNVKVGEWYHLFQAIGAGGDDGVDYVLNGIADHNDPILFSDEGKCENNEFTTDCRQCADQITSNEERIDGLVNQKDVNKLRESAQYIIDDLMDDGFEIEDIRSYLKTLI